MDKRFLNELPRHLHRFVDEVEASTGGVGIEVRTIRESDGAHLPYEPGYARVIRVNGRFRGEVLLADVDAIAPNVLFHEVLHLHRYLVQATPAVKLHRPRDAGEVGIALTLENDLEHLWVIPLELGHFPEARAHWWSCYSARLREHEVSVVSIPSMKVEDQWALRTNLLRDWLVTTQALDGWDEAEGLSRALERCGWRQAAGRLAQDFRQLQSSDKARWAEMLLRALQIPNSEMYLQLFRAENGAVESLPLSAN